MVIYNHGNLEPEIRLRVHYEWSSWDLTRWWKRQNDYHPHLEASLSNIVTHQKEERASGVIGSGVDNQSRQSNSEKGVDSDHRVSAAALAYQICMAKPFFRVSAIERPIHKIKLNSYHPSVHCAMFNQQYLESNFIPHKFLLATRNLPRKAS